MNTKQNVFQHKIKRIEGYDVFVLENSFTPNSDIDKKNSSYLKAMVRSTATPNARSFANIVFGEARRDLAPIRIRNEHIVDDNDIDPINRSTKIHTTLLVDLKKIQSIIDRERSLFVPLAVRDNIRSPWQIVIFDPDKMDEKLQSGEVTKLKNTETKNYFDDILTSYNKMKSETRSAIHTVTVPKSLLKSYYTEHVDIDDCSMTNPYLSKAIILEEKIFRDVQRFRSHIQILFANAIIEKIVKRVNGDLPKIMDLGSIQSDKQLNNTHVTDSCFWSSIVYDDLRKMFNFLGKKKEDSFRVINNDTPHKNYLFETLASIIEVLYYSPHTILTMFNVEGESKDSTLRTDWQIDQYGSLKYLINHPFLFYYLTDGKLQMYKFFVSKLSVSGVEYELYQIDSLNEGVTVGDDIQITTRPKIITRNIMDKFVLKSSINVPIDTKKFVLDPDRSHMNISAHEISQVNDTVLQKINSYLNYVSSIINVIINDASRCIKAFINNQKKVKIYLNQTDVTHRKLEVILNELQLITISSEQPDSPSPTRDRYGSGQNSDQIKMNKTVCESLCQRVAPRFLGDFVISKAYNNSQIYNMYHPISYLSRLMTSYGMTKEKKYNLENFVPIFTNRSFFKQVVLKSEEGSKKVITHKRVNNVQTLRDISFTNDDNRVYHNINGFTQIGEGDVMIDVRIVSNCRVKLYIRIEDNCQMIGEGMRIYIPAIYTSTFNALYFKIDCDPDSVMESLASSNAPPYIKTSYTALSTPVESEDIPSGFVIECVSDFVDTPITDINDTFYNPYKYNTKVSSTVYVDTGDSLNKNSHRIVYFSTMFTHEQLRYAEEQIFGSNEKN